MGILLGTKSGLDSCLEQLSVKCLLFASMRQWSYLFKIDWFVISMLLIFTTSCIERWTLIGLVFVAHTRFRIALIWKLLKTLIITSCCLWRFARCLLLVLTIVVFGLVFAVLLLNIVVVLWVVSSFLSGLICLINSSMLFVWVFILILLISFASSICVIAFWSGLALLALSWFFLWAVLDGRRCILRFHSRIYWFYKILKTV